MEFWYHEPLPGTSPLLNVFIHVSGMIRISPIFIADATEAFSAASGVGEGDGLEDEHREGASTTTVDEDVTSPSTWSPPADMVSTFNSLVGIKSDTWGETKRLGLSTASIVLRSTAPDFGYRPFRHDQCLHVPFNKFSKDNKPFF